MESAPGEGGGAIDVLGGKGCYGHGSVRSPDGTGRLIVNADVPIADHDH